MSDTQLSTADIIRELTALAELARRHDQNDEAAVLSTAARRLDALRWRDADPPPTDGRIRWVATLLGAEKGYYDESAGKWRVWQARPLSAPERWYDDVRVTAYLDWYRPPVPLPAYQPEREVKG